MPASRRTLQTQMLSAGSRGCWQWHRRTSLVVLQDRDAKMMYLQKIFDTVGLVTGQAVAANPAKVSTAWHWRHAWTWAECPQQLCLGASGSSSYGVTGQTVKADPGKVAQQGTAPGGKQE